MSADSSSWTHDSRRSTTHIPGPKAKPTSPIRRRRFHIAHTEQTERGVVQASTSTAVVGYAVSSLAVAIRTTNGKARPFKMSVCRRVDASSRTSTASASPPRIAVFICASRNSRFTSSGRRHRCSPCTVPSASHESADDRDSSNDSVCDDSERNATYQYRPSLRDA
jgi:hypothetical protein